MTPKAMRAVKGKIKPIMTEGRISIDLLMVVLEAELLYLNSFSGIGYRLILHIEKGN